jgi:hypothetical protein
MLILKIIIPVSIVLFSLYWLYRDWLFQKHRIQTVGKIIFIEHKIIGRDEGTDIWGYEFSVSFSTADSNPIVVTYTNTQTNFYYVGMEVNVLYDKDHPKSFVINGEYGSKAYNYVFPFLLLIIGIIVLINVLIR